MLALIGNSPSSGSTLLADLLDSNIQSACGVELNLFSNLNIYSFEQFKKNITATSKASSIYFGRIAINVQRLHSYGLDYKEFHLMVQRSESIQEFSELFCQYFFALRGKSPNSILFEKTPQNINCIGEFLNAFPDSYFIHIVRDPLYVYASLIKRGIPDYLAMMTWLIDVAKYYQYKDNKRVLLVRYEDLTSAPYCTINKLLKQITGKNISEDELKENYANNKYRQLHSKKISSWSVTEYGQINDANKKELPEDIIKKFRLIKNTMVNPRYAELFDLYPLKYSDALKTFGYELPFVKTPFDAAYFPQKKPNDNYCLLKKYARDLLLGDTSFKNLRAYLTPVVRIS